MNIPQYYVDKLVRFIRRWGKGELNY